jgi:enoyl-CoA hydratase/carnithine racemase
LGIRASTLNGVATIEIARPEKKNALTVAMYDAMTGAIRNAVADDAVQSLIFTGQPGIFTAGNDLEDFMARPPTGEDSPVYRFMRALADCDKPVVAAVSGAAVGIGVTMLLHCDLVYVSEDAKLAMPFVSLGLVPEFAASVLVPRLMGHVNAFERLVLGTPFTGAEAVEWRLANAVLPADQVMPRAREAAERFSKLPAGAVRDSKRLLKAGTKDSIDGAMRAEAAVFLERLRSPEAKEALQAFLQKRKPDFGKT